MEPGDETLAVLVVDDDEVFRTRLCRAFVHRGWEATGVPDARLAIAAAADVSPDLALIDLRIPGESGITVVRDLRALDPTTVIIMLTGYGSIATALAAVRSGANDYLSKPVDADQILAAYEASRAVRPIDREPPESVPSLGRVEWEHIQRVLTDCSGNISRAAKLLGMHRRSLQRKLLKYPPAK